ncbi:MAG TPA: response regulator [Deltaproteobacteria bacterium]|nr:response regulator [Deltaproteobacteria bacterium]HPR54819.1 response regulator [Deltaproteobacteria bacterium]HXK46556.1 response regulator [Deltaproteobacteria bacterium]
MAKVSAAIVDDEDEVLDLIEQILKEEGLRTRRFHQAEEVLDVIDAESFDIIISDLMLPGLTGLELLDALHKKGIGIPFVLITGYASLDTAIEAVNRGAFSFIKKPFNIEEIRIVVQRLRQRQDLLEEISRLKKQVELLQSRLAKEVGGDVTGTALPPVMQPLHGASDMSKAFAAIEYLGRLKADGLITEKEFGDYKGSILKRIV